ncbi:IS5 family transposase [Streptomyces sp. M54]|uniref:IS5 family transposase n=2 Tax=Streptomyces TaxID=1883 RepID=UPI00352FFA27
MFRVRTGIPWRDLPERYGSWKTVYERHRRWAADGTWDRLLQAVPGRRRPCRADRLGHGRRRLHVLPGPPACGRRPQGQAAGPERRTTPRHHRPDEGLGRSRGGLTSKIHLAGEGGGRPMALLITPGQWGDAPQMIEVLDRIRVPRLLPGRPRTGPEHFDRECYRRRNEVERTINRLKNSRAVATRYDKRAYVFHGTVTVAAVRLWLRP